MKKFLLLLVFPILFSCSSTSNLTLSVPQPSNVFLSKEVQSIGIVNRSIPNVNYNKLDAIDKILSLEEKNLDKQGANAAIQGLQNGLSKNNRFTNVIVIDSLLLKDFGIDIFSPSLSNNDIEKLCNKYNVNAIYELSFFDTDTNVKYNTVTKQTTNTLGIKIPIIEHQVAVNTLIKSGWRIYDNFSKTLSDQLPLHTNFELVGYGINPVIAFETIKNRKNEVLRISNNLGLNYANQIVPYTIRERRTYFVRGNDYFKIAQRKAQTGDWDGAAVLWEKETLNKNPKIAGRAYYNMAIINEINGDLNAAIDWASKSYSNFNNREALNYLRILRNRVAKNQIIEAEKM